ncbi:hypothetical protein Pla175_04220 [Pirellulimonas nuda]|uniref:Dockerin domain-containing protein n=1 Tax=Pirellulimonas nuda TaxID=2528009 RepID=A0A518D6G2_9BACT|nr:PEP-CTERM sorting domain-containing protein [Pirellulimonas nuda]QDU87067.1 hypothetical protein Pla175_04220 [Pirellulimonas nuda]
MNRWVHIALLLLCVAQPLRASSFGFDDIDFWVGEGANRAALVIDWRAEGAEPLAWGFRWDGVATGRDLLLGVVAADPRLFVKLGGAVDAPTLLFGVGYDTDNDGAFALQDETAFDERGVGFGPAPFLTTTSAEGADRYQEGWDKGYWRYATAAADPYDDGAWQESHIGMGSRTLSDGGWDGWVFESPISYTLQPNPPTAAPAPLLPGDYNRDGALDAADYTVWRDALGQSVATPGAGADGDHSGVVDIHDYAVWRGALAPPSAPAGGAVPEPSSLGLLLILFAAWRLRCFNTLERCTS